MAIISAFADEIDDDPTIQMDTMESVNVRHIELRGAWGVNVMKFSAEQRSELKKMFTDRGFGVACIGSPIGKVKMDDDYDKHFDDFKHAVDLADEFDCRYVRIFSYYPPDGDDIANHRDEIIRRLKQKAEFLADRSVTLVLENEGDIYGETPERCLDLLEALDDEPKITGAFDPANFVYANCLPVYDRCWKPLRKYSGYIHVKDKQANVDGPCCPAGEGDGAFPAILKDLAAAGYDGFMALEPHLAAGGQFGGKTGPDRFPIAARALQTLCDQAGLAYQ
jgi:sugar phosphate isomerase/epimerase